MKRFTIMLMLAAALAALLGGVGFGHAAECRGGSPSNHAGSCESAGNQVTCGDGTDVGLGVLSVSDNGVELCNDGSGALPVQGRVGAEGPDCDCIYLDGTSGNDSPADGWVRIDQNGVHCEGDGEVSYNSGPGQDCM